MGILLHFVLFRISTEVCQKIISLIYSHIHPNIGVIHMSRMDGGSDIRLLIVGCQHDLLHCASKLVR